MVTADPLTLSLRFAAMGELHQTMCFMSTSNDVNLCELSEIFMTGWSVNDTRRKKTRSGRAWAKKNRLGGRFGGGCVTAAYLANALNRAGKCGTTCTRITVDTIHKMMLFLASAIAVLADWTSSRVA